MDYKVKITEDLDLAGLKSLWEPLELIAKPSYFLTWSWIETWLLTYAPRIIVVYAEHESKTVAVGLFTKSCETRHKVVKSEQLRLHQTGVKEMDQIWIEYNDFIADPAHRVDAINHCLNHLADSEINWNEIIIAMSSFQHRDEYQIKTVSPVILDLKPTYSVNLSRLRNEGSNYLESLSSNTRYQIRKSIREYVKLYGDININKANSINQALEYFRIGGNAHKLRWADSGFNNEKFTSFHENLIKNNFPKSEIDIISVQAGDKIVGVSYNFIYNDSVYFYLSGIFYDDNKKLKPGLVMHSLLIQQYLEKGFDIYDFMGGYSRYKESLATRSVDLISLCYQRKRILFSLENSARMIKSKLVKN